MYNKNYTYEVSCVIPVYNSANWLLKTIPNLIRSLEKAKVKNAEILVVDDGSTDKSTDVIDTIKSPYKIIVIKQENSGRFLARRAGILTAKYDKVLLIDSRVQINSNSIKHVLDEQSKDNSKQVWNGHVNVAKKGNIFARFWDALVLIAWRKYFSNPRECSYGIQDFDHYPKGTGCFLAPKKVLIDSMNTFMTQTSDIKNSSDDTLLIRLIAEKQNIHLSPNFACLYYGRSNLKQFTKHAYNRGKFFVDGFLRPGNSFFIPLILYLTLTSLLALVALVAPSYLFTIFIFLLILWFLELFAALLLIGVKDALSLWLLSPFFAIVYGSGIWRAFITKAHNSIKARVPHKIRVVACLGVIILFFAGFAAYYMSPVLSNCSDMVVATGDAGGLIARNELSPNNPLWGYTQKLNYPVGENLNQPTNYAATLFYTSYWATSKVVGPVCALNVINLGGYVFTAVAMFLFTYWLLKNKWIAILAGYAVSFSPYFQSKVGGHPSYGYTALLITLLWLAILVWRSKHKTKLYVSLLGLNTAILAYWDPYFILLGAILLLGFVISLSLLLLYKRQAKYLLLSILPRFIIAAGISLLLMSPLIYVRLHYSSAISSLVSESRSDIKAQVNAYSNRPIEYFAPAEKNPYFTKVFGKGFLNIERHESNPGEYNVGLSLMVLFVVTSFMIIIIWELLSKGKVRLDVVRQDVSTKQLLFILSGITILAFLVSLPPRYGPIRNITDYLTDYVTMWRAYSRLYVVINIAIVIVFSIVLTFYVKHIKFKNVVSVAYIAIAVLIFCEYQAYAYGTRYWSYKTSVSPIYHTLSRLEDLETLAEYPIDDKGTMINDYITAQSVHDKALLNGVFNTEQEVLIRNKVSNIYAPNTIMLLRELGIKAVIIRGASEIVDIPGLQFIEDDETWVSKQGNSLIKPSRLYRVLPLNN